MILLCIVIHGPPGSSLELRGPTGPNWSEIFTFLLVLFRSGPGFLFFWSWSGPGSIGFGPWIPGYIYLQNDSCNKLCDKD